MPAVQKIADLMIRAKLVFSSWINTACVTEKSGDYYEGWGKIYSLGKLISAMNTQVLAGDYFSATTVRLFKMIQCFVGSQFIDGASLDPNAQQGPGVIYVGNNPNGPTYSFEKIPFNATTNVALNNYHANYYPLFGNSPILSIYTSADGGPFVEDTGTVPSINYVDGDITKDITDVTWDYPLPVTGYIQIFGFKPS